MRFTAAVACDFVISALMLGTLSLGAVIYQHIAALFGG